MHGKIAIRLRIPGFDVDAVQDADQITGAILKDAVESEAVRGRNDLARVRRTDGRDRVAQHHGALQRAGASPEFKQARVIQVAAEAEIGELP